MKQFKFLLILSAGIFSLLMPSCESQDAEFPDYYYSAVYFPYQYPVRTIVLGEDIVDNTLDNDQKCEIYATVAGVYSNDKTIGIDFVVDNSICDNLYFDGDFVSPVVAMPSNYYALADDQIVLDKTIQGAVQVQLSDAFFADQKSLENTYVIPLRMTNVVNADSILSGVPAFDNPRRGASSDWDVQPKDYVLYCVKFINPYHANYLRRGVDVITENGATTTNVRHADFVENDEIVKMTTLSLNAVNYPVSVENQSNTPETISLILTFDDQNKCTVSTNAEGFTASGSGMFVSEGEKNSWGNKDRSAIYLDYSIDMGGKSYSTKDTLVVRDRGVTIETFSPSFKFD